MQTVITMAHSMGMRVVAEGVEDVQQYELLAAYGVDEIQGYLLSKPVPADDLEARLLQADSALPAPARLAGSGLFC